MSTPEERDSFLDPVDVREVSVRPETWARWTRAARRNAASAWWGVAAALTLGIVMGSSVLIAAGPSRAVAVGVAALAAVVGWWLGRWLGKRSFRNVADEMRSAICPALVRSARSDDLMRLSRRGAVLFTDEQAHVQSTSREGKIVIIAKEYGLNDMPYIWPSAGGAMGG